MRKAYVLYGYVVITVLVIGVLIAYRHRAPLQQTPTATQWSGRIVTWERTSYDESKSIAVDAQHIAIWQPDRHSINIHRLTPELTIADVIGTITLNQDERVHLLRWISSGLLYAVEGATSAVHIGDYTGITRQLFAGDTAFALIANRDESLVAVFSDKTDVRHAGEVDIHILRLSDGARLNQMTVDLGDGAFDSYWPIGWSHDPEYFYCIGRRGYGHVLCLVSMHGELTLLTPRSDDMHAPSYIGLGQHMYAMPLLPQYTGADIAILTEGYGGSHDTAMIGFYAVNGLIRTVKLDWPKLDIKLQSDAIRNYLKTPV